MKKILVMILALCCLILCGCGKSHAVRSAEEKISAIGYVTAESGTAIEEAEAALNALSLKDREKVENASTLITAREAWRNAVAAKEERERQERLDALRRQIVGSWEFTEEAPAEYAELIDRMVGTMLGSASTHFADYMNHIAATGTFTLRDNNTYQIAFTEAQREAFLNGIIGPLKRYYADIIRELVAQELMMSGMFVEDIHSDDAWIAATGMNFDTLIEADLGMSLDAYIDYVLQMMRGTLLDTMGASAEKQGNYRAEEGKLLISASLEEAVNDERYVNYSLDEDTLTLTGYANVPEFGKEFPVVMSKVK